MVDFHHCLQKEDTKRHLKEFMRPIGSMIYNEMYPYVWFICFYHVFLIFITLANLYLLVRRNNETNTIIREYFQLQ